MKQINKKFWIFIAMLCASISSSAYDFEVNGICYDITSFTDLTVTASSVSENKAGEIVIPSSVEFSGKTLSVTVIGDGFMKNNQAITSLLISDGVREIGSFAFNGCLNLSDVSIPESVVVIKNNAFAKCTNIRNVTATGAKTIGDHCFEGCTNIRNVTATGAETIGGHCFEGCTSIENVTFSKLLNIPSYAFSGCSKLSFAEFPSAHSIGSNAFNGCAFSSFIVSSSVNEIKSYAFSNCKQLESFIIPNNVRSIETGVFKGCSTLKDVTIGSGINNLPWLFGNCSNLEKLRIEDSYSTLSFEHCGNRSFSDGIKGKPVNYTSADYTPVESMFANTTLKEVYIGRNLTTEAFVYKSVYMSGSHEGRYYYYIPNPPFSNSNISKLEIGPLVTDFNMCNSVTPNRGYVNGSWDGAFQNCKNLIETKILSKATEITKNSFAGCSGLRSITLPHTVKRLESGAFKNCIALESIYLGYYLTWIGDNAFSGDSVLSLINLRSSTPPKYSTGFSSYEYINTKVNIPTGSIDSYKNAEPWKNFWNLTESNDLISFFEVDEIEYLVSSGNNVEVVGQTLSSPRKIFIPSTVSYSGTQFAVSSIGDNAFAKCKQIIELEIEEGVTSIGNNAFEGCENLKEIRLPMSINSIGNSVFKNCRNLKICNFAKPIENIPNECFYGCYSLSDISLEDVISIGNSAFYNCLKLTHIVIASSVQSIGTDAFKCPNLKELIIEDAHSPIDFSTGSYHGSTGVYKKEINGRRIQLEITYYNAFFDGLPIEKLYIGRNLSDSPRYTISGDGGVDYYDIRIYDAPFNNLPKLKELTISENVDILGPNEEYISEVEMYVTPGAFKKCSALEKVTVKNTTPPSGVEFSNTAYSKASLVVPDNTVSLYQIADGWKEFLNILDETSSGIEEIRANDSDECIIVNKEGIVYIGESIENVYVYGIDGRLIHSSVVTPNQSVTLPNGMYIITIKNKSLKVKI